ncbi:MAG TPA: MrtC family glutamic-type intramembrane protease [Polyangiaceae bacterium]
MPLTRIERAISGERGALGPLLVALATTAVATALSYWLPEEHAATGVGACFLIAVYFTVLRSADTESIRAHGLSLGGLFDQQPISPKRLVRSALGALAWAAGLALVCFPPFWVGYVLWYAPRSDFSAAPLPSIDTEVFGQLLGIAFPEEAFYRGYLQSALDRAWPQTRRILGAELGAGVVVSSALFALGHYLTEPVPGRLAVFFPSLLFGWLRAKTGGVGAPIAFHALCNLFATYLGRSYRLLS